MNIPGRAERGLNWPALLAAIPLLAAVYDAYDAPNHSFAQQFLADLAPRLAIALIVALVVYGAASALRILILRLNRVSDVAQFARSRVALPPPSWAE